MNGQLLDGGNNIQSYIGEVAINPGVDSVEEFKVQSGVMSAEFGFTSGGVINMVTRSGTNQLHGSVYEFFRNDKLDARNTFAAVKPPFRYNQFGASVGGPVIKEPHVFLRQLGRIPLPALPGANRIVPDDAPARRRFLRPPRHPRPPDSDLQSIHHAGLRRIGYSRSLPRQCHSSKPSRPGG
jgi:hypothetical protein